MAVRVRKDIWDLGDEANPWRDPAILAYARAVGAMQALNTSQPDNGANWTNQAAIHERQPGAPNDPNNLQDRCQHGGWYFLPWHRMYLFFFEEIIRSHMDPAVAKTWALPYWNYSDKPARRVLPPAFRQQNLPGGGRNPLFVSQRGTSPTRVNAGKPIDAAAVLLPAAMRPTVFTRPNTSPVQGFGGGQTGFNHSAPFGGPLENTPHGLVHTAVGGILPNGRPEGFMSSFSTAALDPIFWLHHCNLDRLWEVWRRGPNQGHGPGSNPTSSSWLTRPFSFSDKSGTIVRKPVSEFIDIEGQLNYTYSGLPAPPPAPHRDVEARPDSVTDEQPAEMVGASDEGVTLKGATESTRVTVSEPTGPAKRSLAAGPEDAGQVSLVLDHIEGDTNPGLIYGVFVDLPEGEAAQHESPYYAGAVSFFGIDSRKTDDDEDDEEAPHTLRYAFDITPIVGRLKDEGRWDPAKLDVTITPIEAPDEELAAYDIAPVPIGRISVFVE